MCINLKVTSVHMHVLAHSRLQPISDKVSSILASWVASTIDGHKYLLVHTR